MLTVQTSKLIEAFMGRRHVVGFFGNICVCSRMLTFLPACSHYANRLITIMKRLYDTVLSTPVSVRSTVPGRIFPSCFIPVLFHNRKYAPFNTASWFQFDCTSSDHEFYYAQSELLKNDIRLDLFISRAKVRATNHIK